jgi:hypothetical protein
MPGAGGPGRQDRTATRRSCRAARSSAWPSPARWPTAGGAAVRRADIRARCRNHARLLPRCATSTRKLGVTIVIVSHELSVLGEICATASPSSRRAIAEQFALDDPASAAQDRAGPRTGHGPGRASRRRAAISPGRALSCLITFLRLCAMHACQLARIIACPELWTAARPDLTMLGIGLSAAVLIGGPLGILLFLVGPTANRCKTVPPWCWAGSSTPCAPSPSSSCWWRWCRSRASSPAPRSGRWRRRCRCRSPPFPTSRAWSSRTCARCRAA